MMDMLEIYADPSDQEDDEVMMDTEDFQHFMLSSTRVPIESVVYYQEPLESASDDDESSEQADGFGSCNQVNKLLFDTFNKM